MVRSGLITVGMAFVMVVAGIPKVWSQQHCPGPTCSGGCGVAGGCCPKHGTYGYTETRWSRWPGSGSTAKRSVSGEIPKSDPPTKGEELRDREVREDQKNTSVSQPSGKSELRHDMTNEPRIPADSGMGPNPSGTPSSDLFDPAAELVPPDASGSATPAIPSTVPNDQPKPTPATDSTTPKTDVDPFNGLGKLPLTSSISDLLVSNSVHSQVVEPPTTLRTVDPPTEFLVTESIKTSSAAESSMTKAIPQTRESEPIRARRSQAVQLASASDPIAQRDNPLRLRISRDRYETEATADREPEIVESVMPKVAEAPRAASPPHRKTNPLRRS